MGTRKDLSEHLLVAGDLAEELGLMDISAKLQFMAQTVIPAANPDMPVEDLDISVRLTNVLKHENVRTVGQLAQTGWGDVLNWKNCGIKTLLEIEEVLESVGMRLRSHYTGLQLQPMILER